MRVQRRRAGEHVGRVGKDRKRAEMSTDGRSRKCAYPPYVRTTLARRSTPSGKDFSTEFRLQHSAHLVRMILHQPLRTEKTATCGKLATSDPTTSPASHAQQARVSNARGDRLDTQKRCLAMADMSPWMLVDNGRTSTFATHATCPQAYGGSLQDVAERACVFAHTCRHAETGPVCKQR
jgi:hypothetical protein